MGKNKDGMITRLADGRALSYAEYGDPGGSPVFYFHGWPGSRYEGQMFMHPQIRLIAVERPGMGRSDPKPDRTLLDWAKDVDELADKLNIGRFGVLGFSGGGPYAIACAYHLPERLTAAVVINGLGPLTIPNAMQGLSLQHRLTFQLARRAPWLLALFLDLNIGGVRRLAAKPRTGGPPPIAMPECDRRLIAQNSNLRRLLLRDMLESFQQGTRGLVLEQSLYVRPWGFNLYAVKAPVYLWQGLEDINVSPAMGHYLAENLPDCQAHFLEGEGHISLAYNHLEGILQPFLSQPASQDRNLK